MSRSGVLVTLAIAATLNCPGLAPAQTPTVPTQAADKTPDSLVVYFDLGSSTIRPR